MMNLKNKHIKKIKEILHLDFHCCTDCGWSGKVKSLLFSITKKSKLCPKCGSLQFSLKDPTLRERIEKAESSFIRKFIVNDRNLGEPGLDDRFCYIPSIIDTYDLDEDGITEFTKRVQDYAE